MYTDISAIPVTFRNFDAFGTGSKYIGDNTFHPDAREEEFYKFHICGNMVYIDGNLSEPDIWISFMCNSSREFLRQNTIWSKKKANIWISLPESF